MSVWVKCYFLYTVCLVKFGWMPRWNLAETGRLTDPWWRQVCSQIWDLQEIGSLHLRSFLTLQVLLISFWLFYYRKSVLLIGNCRCYLLIYWIFHNPCVSGCLEMTSTGLFLPLLNDSCTTNKNQQSCEYRGKMFNHFLKIS